MIERALEADVFRDRVSAALEPMAADGYRCRRVVTTDAPGR
jgi:hypothetical protein